MAGIKGKVDFGEKVQMGRLISFHALAEEDKARDTRPLSNRNLRGSGQVDV